MGTPSRARASDTPATRDEGDAGPSSTAPDASRDHLTASAPSPRDPSAAAASDADADDDAPQCRICFSGAEAGRLFAPCHCRGTMRHVHVACLDAWRNASARANNASYHACDQCGFRYRTERGAWASFLEDPKTADRLAWTAISAAVTLAGTLSRAVSTRARSCLSSPGSPARSGAAHRYATDSRKHPRFAAFSRARMRSPRLARRTIGEARSRSTPRARREPSRARSRAARAIPPPRFTSSLRFTASSGGPIRGRRGGTPQAPRDGSPVARLSPTRSTVSSPARSSSARRGCIWKLCREFRANARVRAFPRLGAHRESRRRRRSTFSRRRRRVRVRLRASRRAANHARGARAIRRARPRCTRGGADEELRVPTRNGGVPRPKSAREEARMLQTHAQAHLSDQRPATVHQRYECTSRSNKRN